MTAITTEDTGHPAEPPTRSVLLQLTGIAKSFPGVDALKNVSFSAYGGEVHALVGENGAGKSTLMAVASGSIAPDAGQIAIAGTSIERLTPTLAQQHGVAIVHQHPALLPDLTVIENLTLAVPRELRGGERTRIWARSQLAVVGCDVDVEARIDDLTVAERQLLELAKALAIEPRVLILDEPTAALGSEAVDRLFELIRAAAARGAAVIYISHRLPEVREIAEHVTVMRDGEVTGSSPVDEISDDEILRLIVGRPVSAAFPPKRVATSDGEPALVVEDLSGSSFRGVDLTAKHGEILGLAGIAGNGQSEFLRALAGLGRASGHVRVGDRALRLGRPQVAREAGIAYVSANRHDEGLVMSMSVRENAALSALPFFSNRGVVRRRAEVAAVEEQRDALAIRTPSIETGVSALSGGNQQKVAVARALLSSPALVLADEPTQGVDVGARVEIYRILRDVAEQGIPVIVVSSDGMELEGLCDRVVIFSGGQVIGELSGDDVSEENIAQKIVTATTHRSSAAAVATSNGGSKIWRASRIRHLLTGDYAPSLVLLLIIAALGLYVNSTDGRFLSPFNISSMLKLITALAFISFGQFCVILTAGIDISVGPLAGMLVVIASFFVVDGKSPLVMAAGFVLMFLAALGAGLLNGLLVRYGRFTAVAATLATYIAFQGVSLVLRPTQGGYITSSVTAAIDKQVGEIPVAFIIVLVATVALEFALRYRRWGLNLRAAGSREDAARRLGVRANRTVVGAYVASALFTFLGGIMLMAQIGIGDPSQGVTYTLSSIGAVVLGGVSLFGGRGAFVGVLFGAVLIQEINSSTIFLNLSQAWQYWFIGGLTLAAVAVYSQGRRATKRA